MAIYEILRAKLQNWSVGPEANFIKTCLSFIFQTKNLYFANSLQIFCAVFWSGKFLSEKLWFYKPEDGFLNFIYLFRPCPPYCRGTRCSLVWRGLWCTQLQHVRPALHSCRRWRWRRLREVSKGGRSANKVRKSANPQILSYSTRHFVV